MSKEQVKEYLSFVESVESGDVRIGTNLKRALHSMMAKFSDYRDRVDDIESIGTILIKNYTGQFPDGFACASAPELSGNVTSMSMAVLSATNWSHNIKYIREILLTMQMAVAYANTYVSAHDDLSLDSTEKFLMKQANYIGAGIEQMIKYEDFMRGDVDQVRKMTDNVVIMDDYGTEESDERSERLDCLIKNYTVNSGMEIPEKFNKILWNQYYMLESEIHRRNITDIALDELFLKMLREKLQFENKTISYIRPDLYEAAHSGKKLSTESIFSNIDPEDFDEVCFDVFHCAYMTTASVETDAEEAFSQYILDGTPVDRDDILRASKYKNKTLLSDLIIVIRNATDLDTSDPKFADYFKEVCSEALGFDKNVVDKLVFVSKGLFGYLTFETGADADAYFATALSKYTALEAKIIATEYLCAKYDGQDGFHFNFCMG